MFHYGVDVKKYINKMVNYGKSQKVVFNLEKPTTIQDKLAWLNIYDESPLKTSCADKYLIHEYCKNTLGEDICVPLIAVYDEVEDIEWEKLPSQFAIKCNHGSGMNIIVKDKAKLNKQEAIKKLSSWMKQDFSMRNGFEAHYHDIPRKIIIEEFMDDGHKSIHDYKFWCFNGTPQIYTINDGHGHGPIMYYHMDGSEWNLYGIAKCNEYKKPKTFDKMVELAKTLSRPFKFVRTDFYEVNENVYLGELTFTPGAMVFKYKNKEDNKKVGDLLQL